MIELKKDMSVVFLLKTLMTLKLGILLKDMLRLRLKELLNSLFLKRSVSIIIEIG